MATISVVISEPQADYPLDRKGICRELKRKYETLTQSETKDSRYTHAKKTSSIDNYNSTITTRAPSRMTSKKKRSPLDSTTNDFPTARPSIDSVANTSRQNNSFTLTLNRRPSIQRKLPFQLLTARDDLMTDIQKMKIESLHKKKSRMTNVVEDGIEVKMNRREKLKKNRTPYQIVKHYIVNEHLDPMYEEIRLMDEFLAMHAQVLKHLKNNDLDGALELCYDLMNTAVDQNSMCFFCLMIDFVAQICLTMEDYDRSIYFYEQARLACTFNKSYPLKIDALIGLAANATKMGLYQESIRILKKALQYAWMLQDIEKQLYLYDLMGINFYYLGYVKKAEYFHLRFVEGATELDNSVIRNISNQIIHEYLEVMKKADQTKLTSLFLEYLQLPIHSTTTKPPASNIIHENYGDGGVSPRHNKNIENFRRTDINGKQILEKLLNEDIEFISQIPNPTLRTTDKSFLDRFKKKSIISDYNVFEKTPFYQKRYKKTLQYDHDLTNTKLYKYPLEEAIKKRLAKDINPQWWEKIVNKVKLNKMQIKGKLRDKISNSHLYKRDFQKEKLTRLKQVNEACNTVLLDYIDPLS